MALMTQSGHSRSGCRARRLKIFGENVPLKQSHWRSNECIGYGEKRYAERKEDYEAHRRPNENKWRDLPDWQNDQ